MLTVAAVVCKRLITLVVTLITDADENAFTDVDANANENADYDTGSIAKALSCFLAT